MAKRKHFPVADRVRIEPPQLTEARAIADEAQDLMEQSLSPADRRVASLVHRLADLLDRVVGRPNR